MKRYYLLVLVIILVGVFFVSTVNDYSYKEKAYLTLTFDDGYKCVYTEVLPIFKKYNQKGTVYIITNLTGKIFEKETLMNWSEIKELREHGFEIGSHTSNHKDLTGLSEEEIEKELKGSKEDLWERGIYAESLAIPYGKYNKKIESIAREYYSSVRPSFWGYNSPSNIDRYNLKSKWITNQTNISTIKSWIDEAVEDKKWLILMLHKVNKENSQYSISPAELEEIVKYSSSKSIEIKTVSEIINKNFLKN